MFLPVAQAILLNKLLPQMQALDPSLTRDQIIKAGATGLKSLVSGESLRETLRAYVKGLDDAFILATVLSILSVFLACGVQWKSVKAEKVISDSA